ncbi:TetR/AcrR family transcriptional regulator [Candidatus Solincola tengchongensis]|uniref:TetR/AcrR family transcriptional regulator n=1 Tax=Candidatus Solincola tengchongensis TaxID=2900693 RepID=UPI00257C8B6F|nr:TetR/AcrR family transcriptional regulator [Candidatus Solincola tengchongensis]
MGERGKTTLMDGDRASGRKAAKGGERISKGARTRQRIVGHATLLMYANGYARTSIDDVIRAAGITKGSFYFHFRSKEDLGYAVIENASNYILGRLREVLERPGLNSWERLEAMLREIQRIVEAADCTRGCILGNLALETSHDHPGFREAIAAAFREWWELITSHLEAMKEEGHLPPGFDCRAYAQFAVSAMEGGIMMSKVTRDPGPMRNSIALVLEQLRLLSGKEHKRR